MVDSGGSALEVGDGDDLTCRYFHQDDCTTLCLEEGQLLSKIVLYDTLDIHIEGRVNADSIDRRSADDLLVATHIVEGELLAQFPTQEIVVAKLQPKASLGQSTFGAVVDMTNRTVSKRTKGIDTATLVLGIDELTEESLLISIRSSLLHHKWLGLLESSVLDIGQILRIDSAVTRLRLEALTPACFELRFGELALGEVEGLIHQLRQRVQPGFVFGTQLEDALAFGLLLTISILRGKGVTQGLERLMTEVKEETIDGRGHRHGTTITRIDRATHRLDGAIARWVDLPCHLRIPPAIGTEDEEDNADHHEEHHQREECHDPRIAVMSQAMPFDTTPRLKEESQSKHLSSRKEGLELSGECTQVHRRSAVVERGKDEGELARLRNRILP